MNQTAASPVAVCVMIKMLFDQQLPLIVKEL